MIVESNLSEQTNLNNKRFFKISDREDRCELSKSTWKHLTENVYLRTWKGVLLEDEYMVDSYYQDMYGYNASKNGNSILKIGMK